MIFQITPEKRISALAKTRVRGRDAIVITNTFFKIIVKKRVPTNVKTPLRGRARFPNFTGKSLVRKTVLLFR